ncbi:glycosyltransferase [Halosolutus halophilus]|uniref:glycosyltransferase n=1 Tax=Halosolutus halophilus TaxID=1552990 RepID=UPI0022351C0A|nr:glycosyltransferase [Halosolutus halophilus]
MTDYIGVVIPAYQPDIPTLKTYIEHIESEISPTVVRIEIDVPTQEHIDQLSEMGVEIGVSKQRRGKGAAIMAGFDALGTDICLFADADGSVPASSLAGIIQPITTGEADVSIGSRRHPSSNIITHQTVLRRFLGDVFALGAQYMLPTQCQDYQCGAKAVTADAWSSIAHHCYEPGFAWDLEFVSVAGSLGYKIAEVPVTWEDHPESTVNPLTTSVELGSALIDVKRRTDAIATSPRYRDVDSTDESDLMGIGSDGD